jgi:hypothetical protein
VGVEMGMWFGEWNVQILGDRCMKF